MIKTGKKLIIILGVAALNLAVTGMLGCGSGKEEEPTVTQVENTEEPAEETAEKTEEEQPAEFWYYQEEVNLSGLSRIEFSL